MFQFYTRTTNNLVFPIILNLFLLNDFKKNENQIFNSKKILKHSQLGSPTSSQEPQLSIMAKN